MDHDGKDMLRIPDAHDAREPDGIPRPRQSYIPRILTLDEQHALGNFIQDLYKQHSIDDLRLFRVHKMRATSFPDLNTKDLAEEAFDNLACAAFSTEAADAKTPEEVRSLAQRVNEFPFIHAEAQKYVLDDIELRQKGLWL